MCARLWDCVRSGLRGKGRVSGGVKVCGHGLATLWIWIDGWTNESKPSCIGGLPRPDDSKATPDMDGISQANATLPSPFHDLTNACWHAPLRPVRYTNMSPSARSEHGPPLSLSTAHRSRLASKAKRDANTALTASRTRVSRQRQHANVVTIPSRIARRPLSHCSKTMRRKKIRGGPIGSSRRSLSDGQRLRAGCAAVALASRG